MAQGVEVYNVGATCQIARQRPGGLKQEDF